jgi:hypothetical protein
MIWNHNLIWFLYFFINLLLLALFLRLESFLIVFKYFNKKLTNKNNQQGWKRFQEFPILLDSICKH